MFPHVLRQRVAMLIDDPLVFRRVRVTGADVPSLQRFELRIYVESIRASEF
jgi:hypothetical protein